MGPGTPILWQQIWVQFEFRRCLEEEIHGMYDIDNDSIEWMKEEKNVFTLGLADIWSLF